MSDALTDFEKELFGGYAAGELHLAKTDDGDRVAQMFLMDAEYDPVRITFGPDDEVVFHPGGNKWLTFTADQLRFVAAQAEAAGAMTRDALEGD